ncbi:universal stress protein [Streptomyces spororaveus]|uniref:universal stress protein n=1 Tax=Streptomyces spororaveus TaxID=284039 RepID=UPI0036A7C77A
MANRITVGPDGSGAAGAAAAWAACEAELRSADLEPVHAEDWAQYGPFAAPLPEPRHQWAEDLLALTRERLLRAHSTLAVSTRGTQGAADTALASAAADADMFVLDPGVQGEIADGLRSTLRELLSPWKEKYPSLAVDARTVIGQPAVQILDAAAGAALVVVGRHIRRSALGTRIGPITHAVMHHSRSPVAVVAHD